MPILTVRIGATKSLETTQRVSAQLIELTARILGKRPPVTVIVIDYVDPADWIIAGRSLAERGLASFTFDIKVTDETNTKDEKAQYIREAFEGFRKLLGDMHEESFIHVDDVRAAAYGYGGRSHGISTRPRPPVRRTIGRASITTVRSETTNSRCSVAPTRPISRDSGLFSPDRPMARRLLRLGMPAASVEQTARKRPCAGSPPSTPTPPQPYTVRSSMP